jgi:opacity protein-like surface antigen
MTPLTRQHLVVVLAAVVVGSAGALSAAEQTAPAKPQRPAPTQRPPAPGQGIGIQGFGTLGISRHAAKESFEAVGLDTTAVSFGGGAQVRDLWRRLFVEVSGSRWSGTGERAFVDDEGTRFPLGIPLDVKTTFIDVTVGWRVIGESVSTYAGGGVGTAKYVEESPFAQSGDDLDTRATSYHLAGGVEVPVRSWLAVSIDLRYRFVPDVLGDGGVSAVLEEDRFGGLEAGVGLRVGFGGARTPVRRPTPPPPQKPAQPSKDLPMPQAGVTRGVIIERAPVFLLPDPTRKPLRVLEPSTPLRIVREAGEWLQVEFQDPQFGARQGYVQRKFVRLTK